MRKVVPSWTRCSAAAGSSVSVPRYISQMSSVASGPPYARRRRATHIPSGSPAAMRTSLKIPLTALALAAPWACADSPEATGPRPPLFSRARGDRSPGALYVATNATTGNAILVFPRARDGTLAAPSSFATGGKGSGSGLSNQGGIALTRGNRWLLVVNAGSNEVSVLPHSTRPLSSPAAGPAQVE